MTICDIIALVGSLVCSRYGVRVSGGCRMATMGILEHSGSSLRWLCFSLTSSSVADAGSDDLTGGTTNVSSSSSTPEHSNSIHSSMTLPMNHMREGKKGNPRLNGCIR